MKSTVLCNLTVLQLAALDRAIKSDRQHALLLGELAWTKRDLSLLERVRNIRGLNVIEHHEPGRLTVTIAGTLLPGGFTKVIGCCQKSNLAGV